MPINQRKWFDILAVGKTDEKSFKVSKKMTRPRRHQNLIENMMEQLSGECCYLCSVVTFLTLHTGQIECGFSTCREEETKEIQCCLNSDGFSLYMRAIQDHSGGNKVDLILQDNVKIPYNFIEYVYHVGSSHDLHSIIQSGLIAKGKEASKDGQNGVLYSRGSYEWTSERGILWRDATTSGTLQHQVYQIAVHWINLIIGQKNGLAFWQTRSNAIIPHDPVPADRIEKMVNTRTTEILHQSAHRVRHQKTFLKDAWQVRDKDHHQRGISTGKPVAELQCRETCGGDEEEMKPDIDFRIQGVSHAAVEQKENRQQHSAPDQKSSKQGCINRRFAQQWSLQSFQRKKWKEMVHTMGNIDCFELREISSKAHCLLLPEVIGLKGSFTLPVANAWFLQNSHENLSRENFDGWSIPHFVIKKGARHGACHGKSEAQREYHQAKDCLSAWRKRKRKSSTQSFSLSKSAKFTENRRRISDGMKNSANVLTELHSKIIHMYLLGMRGKDERSLGNWAWTLKAQSDRFGKYQTTLKHCQKCTNLDTKAGDEVPAIPPSL